jgi:metal-responsive CopG/Arc/MetJ family transcriptional regulator
MTDKKQVLIRLQENQIERLDHYAKKIKVSRNQVISNLIDVGLDDLRMLEKTGLLVLGAGLRDLIRNIREKETKQPTLDF